MVSPGLELRGGDCRPGCKISFLHPKASTVACSQHPSRDQPGVIGILTSSLLVDGQGIEPCYQTVTISNGHPPPRLPISGMVDGNHCVNHPVSYPVWLSAYPQYSTIPSLLSVYPPLHDLTCVWWLVIYSNTGWGWPIYRGPCRSFSPHFWPGFVLFQSSLLIDYATVDRAHYQHLPLPTHHHNVDHITTTRTGRGERAQGSHSTCLHAWIRMRARLRLSSVVPAPTFCTDYVQWWHDY